jgi:hypothetical protein
LSAVGTDFHITAGLAAKNRGTEQAETRKTESTLAHPRLLPYKKQCKSGKFTVLFNLKTTQVLWKSRLALSTSGFGMGFVMQKGFFDLRGHSTDRSVETMLRAES